MLKQNKTVRSSQNSFLADALRIKWTRTSISATTCVLQALMAKFCFSSVNSSRVHVSVKSTNGVWNLHSSPSLQPNFTKGMLFCTGSYNKIPCALCTPVQTGYCTWNYTKRHYSVQRSYEIMKFPHICGAYKWSKPGWMLRNLMQWLTS